MQSQCPLGVEQCMQLELRFTITTKKITISTRLPFQDPQQRTLPLWYVHEAVSVWQLAWETLKSLEIEQILFPDIV